MSYGSNIAVEDAEDEYREETARLIAMHAAELVAARDMTRDAAITAAVEHQRYCQEAERDPTGTANKKDTHFNCLNKQHSLNSCPWPAPVAPPSRWPTHLSETYADNFESGWISVLCL